MLKRIKKIGHKLLLVDYSNIIWKAIYANLRLTHRGSFTGGVYGFIKQTMSSVERHEPDCIVICKDSPPYIRKEMYADYKGDRKKMEEDMLMRLTQSKKFVDEFLNVMNIQVEDHKGHEADDIIGHVCKYQSLFFDEIVVKSNDDDLFQLLKKNITLERNKGVLYTLQDFKREFDLQPQQWVDVIALKGSHNAVEGIKGIGIKKAVKIVKDPDLFEKFYADYKEMIDENRKLIRLPLQKLKIKIEEKKSYNVKDLRNFFAGLGIRIDVNDIIKSF